ncbi:uncharacterized protein LOC122017169 [Zingiber officinale]|uniref:uncharacterized protein LOC122017169 n=1 Tax=Zingiber officinale TaxID=94328 RepID=UPI001C4B91F5|nr:uncharacterized protein LOC122017169 [Zingiber officinale]
MDSILSVLVEEVCARAAAGIPVSELWPSLRPSVSAAGLPLGEAVKKAIWVRLLSHPGLRVKADGTALSSQDPLIQSFEGAERIGARIVAEDHLRDAFLGIYDLKASSSEISKIQRAALERLASSRTKGVTQSELGKEFGIKGNNLFYIVRNLESQQLIVRQSTIVRAKELGTKGEDAPTNTSIVSTNLLHLSRYAKNFNLNSQQRFEITRADILEGTADIDGCSANFGYASGDFSKHDVSIKDYLPAMQVICEKLEEACEKVLVVSDIKKSLGYRKGAGHRAWRAILQRLKEANLVEEIQAEVNGGVVICLRLLKKFHSSDFQPKKVMLSHDSFDKENVTTGGKRAHITDQLVELPLEHCIYDMVDAEGQKGITMPEVCRRLGFTSKKLHKRFVSMRERFRLCFQAEIHEKAATYRIWTFENFPQHSSDSIPSKQEVLEDKNVHLLQLTNPNSSTCQLTDSYSSEPLILDKKDCGLIESVPSELDQDVQEVNCRVDQQNGASELALVPYDPKPANVGTMLEMHTLCSEEGHCLSSTFSKVESIQRPRCLPTLTSSRREERIVKKLKLEKIVLVTELYRWLEELEKGKHTKMCRKTLTCILNKLQKQGLCKCIKVSIPIVTNFNRHRVTEVVLHPSIENLSPELLEKIYHKQRDFDMQIRKHASSRLRNDIPVHKFASSKITSNVEDGKPIVLEAMRANGFVFARMVRAKLLHKFLWSYVRNSPSWHDAANSNHRWYDMKCPQSTCHIFLLHEAVKMMPLELFLQVVGSPKEIENMVEHCRLGLRLSDIPLSEYKNLVDDDATKRLSGIINILIRMKLLQLVREGLNEEDNPVLTYAIELKPYIEEPMTQTLTPSHVKVDLHPRIRHDFVLLKLEAVDVYWETLEYCFAAANKETACHAFPGSSVHEAFQTRSWTSLRVMTAEQRTELLNRLNTVDSKKKISFKECIRIARELNLTVEQVLRFSYDKRQSRPSYRYSRSLKSTEHAKHIDKYNSEPFGRKRKRSSTDANENHLSDSRDHENGRNLAVLSIVHAKRFFWNDRLDSQLVIQYARQRAILGTRFYRVEWRSLSDLPALPLTCGRRMALLNSNSNVRRAVMRLCNLLGERYVRYLEKARMEKEPLSQNFSRNHDSGSQQSLPQYFWDNSEDPDVRTAVDEVLQYKRLAKFQNVKRLEHKHRKEWPDISPTDATSSCIQKLPASTEHETVSECDGNKSLNHISRHQKVNVVSTSPNRSSSRHSHGNIAKILNSRYIMMKRKVCESLAVSNAVELLKLVFLNTSASPEAQSSLRVTLQLYSEHEIFAAFNFLKEKNFLVVGHGTQPFVLSKKFWHHASSSPFPVDSGKRSDEFSGWLDKHDKDLMEDGVSLGRDLQCGEFYHLFALVSSGEFSVSPCLPKKGIGEVDETVEQEILDDLGNLKRKNDEVDLSDFKIVKKPRLEMMIDNDYNSRREKGFPGIKVVITRKIISQAGTFMVPEEHKNHEYSVSYDMNNQGLPCGTSDIALSNSCQSLESKETVPDKLPWDALISYAECLSGPYVTNDLTKFSAEIFEAVHSAVCKAGEEGLNMEEISEAMNVEVRQYTEIIVDTLEAFQLVIKVNSYDNVRVLDSSYKCKYFLQSPGVQHAYKKIPCCKDPVETHEASRDNFPRRPDINNHEPSEYLSDGHEVSFVDLPSETIVLDVEKEYVKSGLTLPEENTQVSDSKPKKDIEDGNCSTASCRPILPWINGDGSINTIVLKGLTRRLLGTIMQNPGILEEEIIQRMDVLNPQSCRKLLELMILDNHLTMRRLPQTSSSTPPTLLRKLLGPNLTKVQPVFRKHFFANPLSSSLF